MTDTIICYKLKWSSTEVLGVFQVLQSRSVTAAPPPAGLSPAAPPRGQEGEDKRSGYLPLGLFQLILAFVLIVNQLFFIFSMRIDPSGIFQWCSKNTLCSAFRQRKHLLLTGLREKVPSMDDVHLETELIIDQDRFLQRLDVGFSFGLKDEVPCLGLWRWRGPGVSGWGLSEALKGDETAAFGPIFPCIDFSDNENQSDQFGCTSWSLFSRRLPVCPFPDLWWESQFSKASPVSWSVAGRRNWALDFSRQQTNVSFESQRSQCQEQDFLGAQVGLMWPTQNLSSSYKISQANKLDNFYILLQITEEPEQVQGNGPRFSAFVQERLDLEPVFCLGGTPWTWTSIRWEGEMFVC